MHCSLEVLLESAQQIEPLRCRFHNLVLRLKNLSPVLVNEHAHNFAHAPTGTAQNLEAVDARHQQGYAVVSDHTDTLRKTIKGLEFKPGEINTLELGGKIQEICKLVICNLVICNQRIRFCACPDATVLIYKITKSPTSCIGQGRRPPGLPAICGVRRCSPGRKRSPPAWKSSGRHPRRRWGSPFAGQGRARRMGASQR